MTIAKEGKVAVGETNVEVAMEAEESSSAGKVCEMAAVLNVLAKDSHKKARESQDAWSAGEKPDILKGS